MHLAQATELPQGGRLLGVLGQGVVAFASWLAITRETRTGGGDVCRWVPEWSAKSRTQHCRAGARVDTASEGDTLGHRDAEPFTLAHPTAHGREYVMLSNVCSINNFARALR